MADALDLLAAVRGLKSHRSGLPGLSGEGVRAGARAVLPLLLDLAKLKLERAAVVCPPFYKRLLRAQPVAKHPPLSPAERFQPPPLTALHELFRPTPAVPAADPSPSAPPVSLLDFSDFSDFNPPSWAPQSALPSKELLAPIPAASADFGHFEHLDFDKAFGAFGASNPSSTVDPFAPPTSSDPFPPPNSNDPFAPLTSTNPFAPPNSNDPFAPPTSSDPFAPPPALTQKFGLSDPFTPAPSLMGTLASKSITSEQNDSSRAIRDMDVRGSARDPFQGLGGGVQKR